MFRAYRIWILYFNQLKQIKLNAGPPVPLKTLSIMKTTNLKFSKTYIRSNGENLIVNIRLNDQCKNGHQDFSITGDLYSGKGRSDRSLIAGGCIHDEILKTCPEFKIFTDLHLCDYNGVPMHAIANGYYHMQNGYFSEYKKLTPEEFKTKFCEYYRVTPAQFDELKKAKDQNYFGFLIYSLGILDQWKEDAKKAIAKLEELTGDTFIVDSEKSQFNMEPEQLKAIESKVKEGFYSDDKIEAREEAKAQAAKAEKLEKLESNYKQALKEKEIDYLIDKTLINLFGTCSNVIYYKHTDEVVFNWSGSSYDKNYTSEEFEQFKMEAFKLDILKPLTYKLGK